MNLDYLLSEDWAEKDLATAEESDLRYFAAPGDIILRNDQTDLSARWGWIPLIDFALALREITEALAGGNRGANRTETFEFTESEATLQFERKGEEVIISASYSPGKIIVPLSLFREQVKEFARRLDADLLIKHPELDRNQIYQSFKLSAD